MPHWSGTVLDDEGELLGHFEYNGTVDVARPQVFDTLEELEANWRGPWVPACKCAGVECTLVVQDIHRYSSRVCPTHKLICGELAPPDTQLHGCPK